MNDDERTNSDLTVVGLLFFLLISLGLEIKTNYQVKYLEKELVSTVNVVYYVSDKLNTSYNIIDSLNTEQQKMQLEINGLIKLQRIKKELDRSSTRE